MLCISTISGFVSRAIKMSGQMLPMSTDLGSQRFLKGKSIVVIGRWILLWLPGIGLGGLWFTVRVDWAVDAHAVLGSLNVKPDLLSVLRFLEVVRVCPKPCDQVIRCYQELPDHEVRCALTRAKSPNSVCKDFFHLFFL